MITQTLHNPSIGNLMIAVAPNDVSKQLIFASSRDYGFDYDQDELARELQASLPANHSSQPIHQVTTDEFESSYIWFIS